MITHYRDETVVVTTSYLQINGRTIPLSDLEHVWHDEVEPDWRVRGRAAGRGVLNIAMLLCGAAGLVLLVGLGASAYLESETRGFKIPTNTLLLLAVVLLVIGVVPLLWEWALSRVDDSYDKGSACYEIWAICRGRRTLLLRIDDATRFGKIYRAMERAIGDQ